MKTLLCGVALILLASWASAAEDGELTAARIMAQAMAASGGDAWRYARTNVMAGNATLYRNGRGTYADRYEMRRVYPERLEAAHTNTGKFRLDAYVKDQQMFSVSFDGSQMYNQNGPMPEEQARELAASSFGFSAVRFALENEFALQRLADDQVSGQPSYFVQITDPSGGKTLAGVDKETQLIRYVGWQTPRGWHHRIYSEYYELESGFMQPGRVRLYYDGVKTADINWISAELDVELPDSLFVQGIED